MLCAYTHGYSNRGGITLIALVITIIVLLILAGITISILFGDNGVLKEAMQAKDATRGGEVQEIVRLQASTNIGEEYNEGTKKTRDEVISELHSRGKLTDKEVAILKESDTITIGGITIDFSVFENASGNLTLGAVYDSGDLKIGDKLTYSSNGQSDWIVFGKDTEGNILITTELPIEDAFILECEPEAWLKFESDTDSTYGLNKACSTYGGKIQGITVNSRSIKIEDINYLTGLTQKTVTEGENTYNIQSFDTYTFGTTHKYNNKQVKFAYPILTGGTMQNGTGTGFWKVPKTKSDSTTFENNWYGYFCDRLDGQYKYYGADTNSQYISATTLNLNTENFKYIWGGDTTETCYNYLVASRSVEVTNMIVKYCANCVKDSGVYANGQYVCGASRTGSYSSFGAQLCGIRPVVVLPPTLQVKEVETGRYDLAQ